MANRYWVLGSGTWNLSNTVNWSSTSSIGYGGASVPTSSDDVYFNVGSNVSSSPFTVTLGASVECNNFNVITPDGPMTINLGTLYTNTLTIYGSVSISTTATLLYYSSTSPSWAATSSNFFTTTNFIKMGMTATSMSRIPISTSITKISGSANITETPVFADFASPRLAIGSAGVSESPVFPTVLSTSLAFMSNNPLFLPARPINAIEKFGEINSNGITPLPYQFWG